MTGDKTDKKNQTQHSQGTRRGPVKRGVSKSAASTRSAQSKNATNTDVDLVGKQLRYLRRKNQLTLAELAGSAGCSESLLSRIENDIVIPSLSTLHKICRALDISIVELLGSAERPDCVVYKAKQRPKLGKSDVVEGDGSAAEILIPHSEDCSLEGFLFILPPDGPMCGPFRHAGEEVGYILDGKLELVVDGEEFILSRGDSFFFHSNLPHSYRAAGAKPCRIIWVNAPPTF